MLSIPCKQFVWGKLLGASRGSYRVVARSENILDEFVTEVRQTFKGCRPQSVDVSNFNTTLIATPFLKKYFILLRMELFHDHDLGHFIQEHYVIVEKDHLFQQVTANHFESKPWFWLLNIPDIRLYSSLGELSNTVSLNLKTSFLPQIGKITSLLTIGNNVFDETLKNTISLLLSAPPAVIQVTDDDYLDKRFWCIALSLLLPAKETSNLRIFIGRNPPDNWNFELGIVTKNSLNQKMRISDQVNLQPENQDNKFLKFSVLVKRWLDLSRSKKFITDLIDVIDKVNVDWQSPIIQNYQANFDVAFGISAMSTIGLILAREDVHKGIVNPAELQWIWRNMSHRNGDANNLLTTDDLLNFLPILIRENLNNWNPDDFVAFSDMVSNHVTEPERLFLSFEGSDETLLRFLRRWIKTNDFSDKEEKLFFFVMKKVASEKFSIAMELFFEWVEHHQKRDINLFYFLSELVGVQREPISVADLARLFFVCSYQSKSNEDLNQFVKIVWKLSVEKDANEHRNSINIFLSSVRGQRFAESEQLDIFRFLANIGQTIGLSISDIVFAFFHIVIVAKNAEMFETLSIIVHSNHHQLLSIPARKGLESDWHETAQIWVLNADNTSLFAAYIYILMRFADSRIIQEILTNLLIKTPIFFSEVVHKLLDKYSVERRILTINLTTLQGVETHKRLHLLSEFLLSTRSKTSHPTIEEADVFHQTILTVDNIKTIETKKQPHLISLFQSSEDNDICQRIVEHQIRDALNQRTPNFDKAKEKLQNFKTIMRQTKASWDIKSKLQPNINITLSYIRGLNEEEFNGFLQWFLRSPLDSFPPIDTQHYPATASVVKLNVQWLKSDPFVRLRLFEETITILQQ